MGDVAGRAGTRIAQALAASVLQRVPALADSLVHAIDEQNPGYRTVNVVSSEDLWRSCHDNITRVLQLIAGDDPAPEQLGEDGYYDAARATGRRRAEQRMPLDDVLRSFRIGGRLVWEALIGQAREDHDVDTDGLLDVATRVWEVVDQTSAQVADAYHITAYQLVRADEQRNAALWEGLLQGRARDIAFAYEVARTVGLPVDGPYLAVVAAVADQPRTTIVQVTDGLAGCGIDSAWQIRASAMIGLLSLGTRPADVALEALRRVPDVHAGVSLVVTGLAAVNVAYRQASLALRTVASQGCQVVALRDRIPDALLLDAPELTEELLRLWLGPLLELPAAERELLLDTLDTWVATSGSATRTAKLAHCHRNTVINRIRRIQSIIGHDLPADGMPMELSLALRAARLPAADHSRPARSRIDE